jgi:hypothetical protein
VVLIGEVTPANKLIPKLAEKCMVTAMNKRLISLSIFVIAVVLYFIGMSYTAAVFLVLGAVAEAVFWVRFFNNVGQRDRE